MMKFSIDSCVILLLISTTILSDAANVLETKVITEDNETIELKWTKVNSFLANGHLPIWTTTSVPNRLLRDNETMEKIGNFTMYHDLEKSSAIIVIEKYNCIYGIIDVRYQIACLPLNKLNDVHEIGESEYLIIQGVLNFDQYRNVSDSIKKSIRKNSTFVFDEQLDEFKMYIKSLIDVSTPLLSEFTQINTKNNVKQYNNMINSFSKKYKRHVVCRSKYSKAHEHWSYEEKVITVYPEILILVSVEVARMSPNLLSLVLQYIVKFNAVSMLFAKLKSDNIKININIAGIIVDTYVRDFPSDSLLKNGKPNGTTVLDAMSRYLKFVEDSKYNSDLLFNDDSFDMFLLSTGNEWQEREIYPGGISSSVVNLMTNRIYTHVTKKKLLGSIVDDTRALQYYINAAREIAHLFTVQNDPMNDVSEYVNEPCYIMSHSERHCPKYLKWSRKSVNDFKKYLSVNTNRCFLLNQPRSLYPHDQLIKSLNPADQCLCYGYWPGAKKTYLNNDKRGYISDCAQSLACTHFYNMTKVSSLPIPLDGTPCDKYDTKMVCWREFCKSKPDSAPLRSEKSSEETYHEI